MSLSPIALADLGAGLDAAISASGVAGRTFSGAPLRLVLAARVATSTARVRLYRRDNRIGRWVPSAAPAITLDPGVDAGIYELRYETAGVPGDYGLVQESGTGVVEYSFYVGAA